jgi:hypothetical protein
VMLGTLEHSENWMKIFAGLTRFETGTPVAKRQSMSN